MSSEAIALYSYVEMKVAGFSGTETEIFFSLTLNINKETFTMTGKISRPDEGHHMHILTSPINNSRRKKSFKFLSFVICIRTSIN